MTPLPAAFLAALEGRQEVLVTSRDGSARGTVPVWFVVAPPGVVYLFSYGFSVKVGRWRADPWIRLTVPGTGVSTEGVVHFVPEGPELEDIAPLVVEKWGMWGATTVEGLRRVIRDGTYVLVRVEGLGRPAVGAPPDRARI
jgi:hypothetical protein